jgi:2-polyprenyl-3-methyl-5-hydroxy-6-metoxy-1,4-benzoquinol methylase
LENLVTDYSATQTIVANDAMACVGERSCRLCGAALSRTFANLGLSPLANSFIKPERQDAAEAFYPLHAYVCDSCHLVQLSEFESPQAIFGDYLYFSSYSESWLRHAKAYVEKQRRRFGLGKDSLIVEIASNDGYLLQSAVEAGINVLGIEPAANVAEIAKSKGVRTEVAFFGAETGARLRAAGYAPDLMVANNVVAHVPDLHDFLEGFRQLLAPGGVVTFEFPHLLRLIAERQFDTIYHEHFSYLSLRVLERALADHGLTVFDVEELPTHGGSLRVYAKHTANAALAVSAAVSAVREAELQFGLSDLQTYENFAEDVVEIKCDLLEFLIQARRDGKIVAAYGAPAKGNTLLNYCGVGPELVKFTVDASPHKQQTLLPGTRIPVLHPDAIRVQRPDYVLILPWNLKEEIMRQMEDLRNWGGQFVVPIPKLAII